MYKDEKFEARQNDYRKCKFNLLEQRERNHLSLRKQKIEEIIFQKRLKKTLNDNNSENDAYTHCKNIISLDAFNNLEPRLVRIFSKDEEKLIASFQQEIELIFQMLKGQDDNKIFSIFLIRIYLSLENASLDLLIKREIFDILKDFLERESNENIIYELYWILINISYLGDYEKISILLNDNFINIHAKFLKEQKSNSELIELILWLLRNVGCEDFNLGDIFLKSHLVDNMTDLINFSLKMKKLSTIKSILGLYYDCLKHENINHKHEEIIQTFYKLFDVCANLIALNDDEVFSYCLGILKHISGVEDPNNPFQLLYMFMQNNGEIINILLAINYDENKADLSETVRIFGNLLSVNDNNFIDDLLQFDLLKFFKGILDKEKSKKIRKETIWAISNITGGSYKQIKMIVDSDLFDIIKNMTSDYDFSSRKEAVYALSNMCADITLSLGTEIVKKGIFEVFIKVIEKNIDISIIEMALDSIDRIINTGEALKDIAGFNSMAKKFDEVGGCNCLEQLQKHPNQNIYGKTVAILVKYYETKQVDYEILGNNSHLGNSSLINSVNFNSNNLENLQSSNPNYNFFGPNGAVELQNGESQIYPYQINSSTNYQFRM